MQTPDSLPSSSRDAVPAPILRHHYGGQLESAAEAFLISIFDRAMGQSLNDGAVPPILVSAAMHILNRSAWTQPTDEQTKAAMYLQSRPSSEPAE